MSDGNDGKVELKATPGLLLGLIRAIYSDVDLLQKTANSNAEKLNLIQEQQKRFTESQRIILSQVQQAESLRSTAIVQVRRRLISLFLLLEFITILGEIFQYTQFAFASIVVQLASIVLIGWLAFKGEK